jgi:hypothetical protein
VAAFGGLLAGMKRKHPLLLALSLSLFALNVGAQTVWTGTADSAVSNSGNWSAGLPNDTGANDGIINNGDTVEMGSRDALDGKNYIVSGGSTIHGDSAMGSFRWNSGTITLNGGNLDIDTTGENPIGRDAGSITTLNINAGSTVTFAGTVSVGRQSQGIVNQNGGSFTVAGSLTIQSNSTPVVSNNVYNLSAGTVQATSLIVNDRNSDNSNYFNFTTGSVGMLTILQSNFNFAAFITAGDIRINGNAASALSDFVIDESVLGQSTLSLVGANIPEPSSFALLLGGVSLLAVTSRRRR